MKDLLFIYDSTRALIVCWKVLASCSGKEESTGFEALSSWVGGALTPGNEISVIHYWPGLSLSGILTFPTAEWN